MKSIKLGRESGIVVALVMMIIVFSLIDPIYLSSSNIVDIVKQSTINGLLGIGITLAIITGGIDLSIGSTFAIVIVSVGKLLVSGVNPFLAFAIGIILGFSLGIVNGILVAKVKLQPFIATLGTMSIYRGVAYIITGGWPVLDIPENFRKALDGDIFGVIPSSVVLLFVVGIIIWIILKYTRFGNYIYALGSNEEATKLSGVNVDFNKMMAYAICGVGAALAGMVLLARLGTGEPTAGQGYELNAIAAAAVGGTSLMGGKGTMLGTILGTILLSALRVGLIVVGVDSFWQYIATGIIIVIAACFEIIQNKISSIKVSRSKLSKA
ncbi:Ribose transport system permease protein rbsC [Sebaldella termitidis]|jgi:ribose transport system permease protein|uniref:Inner-membrane translocator n=1 Tax=Sebaldella termitidis (strain ATCC 33386 / NCTC 11300) TaxID=526218 RepID=D1AKZ4_SEBTE|nr:ABC transporter permease [Sebaldella termitidis]ACZ07160.1 inner-membrane translocator [Sebaldella termitidis ATCC 33386]MBP7979726.1 ABC transporter permease [Sebaldella sp.]SUI22451.1 Ribose transport system permease protein rbsC [Sebaldella termitidis]